MQRTSPSCFLKSTGRGGRLVWYVLPFACILWLTSFYAQRQSHMPIAGAAAASFFSRQSASSSGDAIDGRSGENDAADGKDEQPPAESAKSRQSPPAEPPPPPDACAGRYVYVHDLPSRFNTDMLGECRTLSLWTDMCPSMSNRGLGPHLGKSGGVFSGSGGWYATNQFALDVIFYNRMKQYDCLTVDSSRASAVFVPFFAGLDAGRYLWGGHNASLRDAASLDLFRWLRSTPEWGVMGGRDHFLAAGRIAWDFRRLTDSDSDWGNKLLLLPEAVNTTVLVLESGPWHGNDISVPYPTYFHPSTAAQVSAWQRRMRRARRPWLFSFAGAPRPDRKGDTRGRIIEQCRSSARCKLLDCGGSRAGGCHSPRRVIAAFRRSAFCLQPPGDSYTRRSAFDAVVAGCVPVFFHRRSAYAQYRWHLPRNHSSYSVFIPEEEAVAGGEAAGNGAIEERLARIPAAEVAAMRDEVIRMIPRVVYADPAAGRVEVKDAFELAVEGVIGRVAQLRKAAAGFAMDAASRLPAGEDRGRDG